MQAKSTFGNLLENFRFQRKEAMEKVKRELLARHPDKKAKFKFEESSLIDSQGDTVYTVELWQKVDEQQIKIKASVDVNFKQQEESADLKDLMT